MNNVIGPKTPIPTPIPNLILKTLKRIWGKFVKVLEVIFLSKDINEQKPLNTQKSSADDIAQIHKILSDFRSQAQSAGGEIIKSIKADCDEFFEKTIKQFEHYSDIFGMTHMTGTYKKRFASTLDELDKVFDNCISKKYSLDDNECVSILKMVPGESKANRMTEFKKATFSLAINETCISIEKSIEQFFDTIDDTFIIKINSVASSVEEKTAAFEKLTIDSERTDSELEAAQLNALEIISITDLAFELLEGSVN